MVSLKIYLFNFTAFDLLYKYYYDACALVANLLKNRE